MVGQTPCLRCCLDNVATVYNAASDFVQRDSLLSVRQNTQPVDGYTSPALISNNTFESKSLCAGPHPLMANDCSETRKIRRL